jgi:signal transduction histidine kinase
MSKDIEPLPSKVHEQYAQLFSKMEPIDYSHIDAIAQVAATICNTPVSRVNFINGDSESFMFKYGLDAKATPLDHAFCAEAILQDDLFIVEDSRLDERFAQNPYVTQEPKILFYAGLPLITNKKEKLGTLCVLDYTPRTLNDDQVNSLKTLAKSVIAVLELRHSVIKTKLAKNQLRAQNEKLMSFAYTAAHDIKSPLGNIIQLSKTIETDDRVDLEEARTICSMISSSAFKLNRIIDGTLEFSKKTRFDSSDIEDINIKSLFQEGIDYAQNQVNINFTMDVDKSLMIRSNRNALERIMVNLVVNGIKYCDKEVSQIKLSAKLIGDFITFDVSDNGPGIAKKDQTKIFEMFQTTSNVDKQGKKGTGIGLSTVLSLVEQLGGNMQLESELGKGSKFSFILPQDISV